MQALRGGSVHRGGWALRAAPRESSDTNDEAGVSATQRTVSEAEEISKWNNTPPRGGNERSGKTEKAKRRKLSKQEHSSFARADRCYVCRNYELGSLRLSTSIASEN